MLSVLEQTTNLTRAAMEHGIIRKYLSDLDLVVTLSENSFFKPIRRVKSATLISMMDGLNIDD